MHRTLHSSVLALALIGAAGGLAAWTAQPHDATKPAPPAPPVSSAPAAKAPATEGGFTVDAVHSSVLFRIKHQNAAYFYGRFNDVSGTFDPREGGSMSMTVKADSVDTGNGKRDQHLKSADFFSVKEFPEISFTSTSFKKTGEHTYDVAGDLTFHGVTKPVTVKVEHTGTADGRGGGKVAGIEAKATIKRSEFGMNFGPGALGEEVDLIVSVEGGAK